MQSFGGKTLHSNAGRQPSLFGSISYRKAGQRNRRPIPTTKDTLEFSAFQQVKRILVIKEKWVGLNAMSPTMEDLIQ